MVIVSSTEINTRNAKIKEGGGVNIFIAYENTDYNIFFSKIREMKITRGHNYTLVKKENRLDFRKYLVKAGCT